MKNAWSVIVAAQWIGMKGTEYGGALMIRFCERNRRLRRRPVKGEALKWGRAHARP